MTDYSTKKALIDYVETATNLAEAVRKNIMHSKNGVAIVDDKTVLALNKFIIASNAIKDLQDQLYTSTIKFN